MKRKLLLVDDEPEQHQLLGDYLSRQGYSTQSVGSAPRALDIVREDPPDMVIMDVRMPGMSGIEALAQIRRTQPDLPVLLITAYTDIRDAVRAMKDGAVDYLSKPVDLDELMAAIGDAIGPVSPTPSDAALPALPPGVVVASPAMRHVVEQIALIAPSDASLVLTGESGTGK